MYQRLNAIAVADSYSLPRIDDPLHAAKRTPFMSTMGLRCGFHQINVKESDKFGFGLPNGQATFQRLID